MIKYQKDKINTIIWHDKRLVSLISSFHDIPTKIIGKITKINAKIPLSKMHMKIHTEIKDITCKFCRKGFNQQGNFQSFTYTYRE
ncbi:hypothetical protein A3Q56_05120 [Intoshia linei]|uniref:Uncharacterized protein n=1 Tax=Intoshia linei TaxID=1819745 RepID=A0A177AYT4_9BILA|nr:hypothetical protein A3Q56_05120 [Intoshia linei]